MRTHTRLLLLLCSSLLLASCSFSTFDLVHNGQVTLGQATQNLPQVLLEVDGDDVFATGVIRLIYGYANTLQGAEMVGGTA